MTRASPQVAKARTRRARRACSHTTKAAPPPRPPNQPRPPAPRQPPSPPLRPPPPPLIVCICNELRDRQICAQRDRGACTVRELFASLDCEPRCASCVPEIEDLL